MRPHVAAVYAFARAADDFADEEIHEDAERLLTELGIQYPAAYAVDASAMQPYGVRVMPTTVFLSADGKIVKTTNGALREPQLRAELEQLVTS